jgi:hypothetical protein
LGAVRTSAAYFDSIAQEGMAVDLFAEGTANEHVAAIPPLYLCLEQAIGDWRHFPGADWKYRVGCCKMTPLVNWLRLLERFLEDLNLRGGLNHDDEVRKSQGKAKVLRSQDGI